MMPGPAPPGFWDDPAIRTALAELDFGPVFSRLIAATGMTQQQISDLTGVPQPRISHAVCGRARFAKYRTILGIARGLDIPPELLGMPVPSPAHDPQESPVDRRHFLATVAAALFGSSMAGDVERVRALLPTGTTPVARPRIGAADVESVRAITDGFRRSAYANGGGLGRAGALAYLHEVQALGDAVATPAVRTELDLAVAELANVAGWMVYDVDDHDGARRLWTYTIDAARRAAGDPRAADLTVTVLLDMAHQALYLHYLDPTDRTRVHEATHLMRMASSEIADAPEICAPIRGYGHAVGAWCAAAAGRADRATAELDDAQAIYLGTNPTEAPAWAGWLTPAETHYQQGRAALLLSDRDTRHAATAVESLTAAIDGWGHARQRSRAMARSMLAVAYLRTGDPDEAARVGHAGADDVMALSTTRGYRMLDVLDREAAGHAGSDVAGLREHIRTALAGAAV